MHMCGHAPGIQIRSNGIHSNHHRALVLHGISNSTWQENVVFRTVGHMLLTEDGAEEGNKIVRNILALPQIPAPGWAGQCGPRKTKDGKPLSGPESGRYAFKIERQIEVGEVEIPWKKGKTRKKKLTNLDFGGCEPHRCSHGIGIYEAICGNRHDGEVACMWISNPANLFEGNRLIPGKAVGFRFETRGITGLAELLPAEEKQKYRAGAGCKSQSRHRLGGFRKNVVHSGNFGIFNYPARRDSAEHFSRLNALLFTAVACIFIPAYCFAIP